jgi:uncharacterized protein (TIGR02118 family)
MIKLVFTLRRREGMTREDFQHYWREKHAPLVRQHAAVLHLRRYVQVHLRETPANAAVAAPRGSAPAFYDGVAELYWDSLEDLAAVLYDEAALAAAQELLEDEQCFIDLPNSPLWLGEENVVVGAP